jgi:hypothetical protein
MPAAIPVAATIASSVIGAGASIYGANKASSAADKAAQANIALAREFRADNHEMLDPFVGRGDLSGNAIMALLGFGDDATVNEAFGRWRDSTSYDWVLDQAIEGVDQSAASRGNLHSGATMAAVSDRARSVADASIGDYMGHLYGQQGAGLQAAGLITGSDANILGHMTDANNSRASAQGNAALATGGSINSLISNLALAWGMHGNGGGTSAYRGSPSASGTTLFGQPVNYGFTG